MTISIDQTALNLATAVGLGAVIGFERQWRNRLAGLRVRGGDKVFHWSGGDLQSRQSKI